MINGCKISLFSSVGNSRGNQEDNALFMDRRILSEQDLAFISTSRETYATTYSREVGGGFMVAVSDGMGGHACGEVASALTVGYLAEHYDRIIESAYLNERAVVSEIGELNRRIVAYSKSREGLRGMGATLCGVICSKGLYYGFSVGDSRMYRYAGHTLEQLSEDHTEGRRLRKLNLLSEEELETFPRRKNLYKYIGMGGDLIADVFKISSCIPGTTLLLCSDGLTDVILDEEISTVLGSPALLEEKGSLLLNRAKERNPGHGDNITLLLIEF